VTYLYIHSNAEPASCFPERAQLKSVPNSHRLASSSQTKSITSGGRIAIISEDVQCLMDDILQVTFLLTRSVKLPRVL
jgi:hypothetical protein